jgi:hypothetical protein
MALAEREGFEPSIRVDPVYRISRKPKRPDRTRLGPSLNWERYGRPVRNRPAPTPGWHRGWHQGRAPAAGLSWAVTTGIEPIRPLAAMTAS